MLIWISIIQKSICNMVAALVVEMYKILFKDGLVN